jgi:hypothetical protein
VRADYRRLVAAARAATLGQAARHKGADPRKCVSQCRNEMAGPDRLSTLRTPHVLSCVPAGRSVTSGDSGNCVLGEAFRYRVMRRRMRCMAVPLSEVVGSLPNATKQRPLNFLSNHTKAILLPKPGAPGRPKCVPLCIG